MPQTVDLKKLVGEIGPCPVQLRAGLEPQFAGQANDAAAVVIVVMLDFGLGVGIVRIVHVEHVVQVMDAHILVAGIAVIGQAESGPGHDLDHVFDVERPVEHVQSIETPGVVIARIFEEGIVPILVKIAPLHLVVAAGGGALVVKRAAADLLTRHFEAEFGQRLDHGIKIVDPGPGADGKAEAFGIVGQIRE